LERLDYAGTAAYLGGRLRVSSDDQWGPPLSMPSASSEAAGCTRPVRWSLPGAWLLREVFADPSLE